MNVNRLVLLAVGALLIFAGGSLWADAGILRGPHGSDEAPNVGDGLLFGAVVLAVLGLATFGFGAFAQRTTPKPRKSSKRSKAKVLQ